MWVHQSVEVLDPESQTHDTGCVANAGGDVMFTPSYNTSADASDATLSQTYNTSDRQIPDLLGVPGPNRQAADTDRGSIPPQAVTARYNGSVAILSHLDLGSASLSSADNISSSVWFNRSCEEHTKPNDSIKIIVEPIFLCIGILGILLTLSVLTRKFMSNSCNCYLTALAVGDLMMLLVMCSKNLMEQYADCRIASSAHMALFTSYSTIAMETFQYLTVGVTVMLAVERYLAICHPMRAMGMCTIKRARIIIAILFLITFTVLSPKFLDLQLTNAKEPITGETLLTITHAYYYNNALYTYIVTVSLLTVLPLLTLLILNGRIIYEIRRSSRYLQNYLGVDCQVRSVVSNEELKITMMLISVVVAFFVCHVPQMLYNAVTAVTEFDSEFTSYDEWTYIKHACHSLLALKSTCNFVLYCWFSDKFWVTFKRNWCRSRCRTEHSNFWHHRSNNNGHHGRCYSHTHPYRSSFYVSKETTC
ncbi:thyrotropin-releasing hormone receptor-like [Physella acuta]|uniref:thyrotropin-releasing hormone receptor-like n=1 Tax=Physella acuta TaxID=109671 RepID=UPI0027DB2555|nr:thyrotropin-releasing hormone receptor-like [Physella acuta]